MKHVENYWVEYCNSGIIHLLFNTKERWLFYHRYSDHLYRIGGNVGDDETVETLKPLLCEIPNDKLVFKDNVNYLTTNLQEKDQISFYFIPFELIKNKL